MPFSDLHKRKKTKNLIFLGLIFAWIVLIWAVTMIKLSHVPAP